ncbi:MAG: atpC [Alphaproteobacteria bacterium]|nr:atpC [Alphaproteobacteria bacterium]
MAEGILVNQRQFRFELVAPEKTEVSSLEQRVMLPGEKGDFMVLGGHTLLLAGLRNGVVSVMHANGSTSHYFITGGLADIGNEHCTVLTPHIIPMAKLVAEKLQQDLDRIEGKLSVEVERHAVEHLENERVLLQLKLEAATKYNA